jgi:antitoxin component HigA of HigAB toxin-antitoxin module
MTATATRPKNAGSPRGGRGTHASYLRLAERWPPHPIVDEREYHRAAVAVDDLATRSPSSLDVGERHYFEAVAAFIAAYDREHFDKPVATLAERIEHLLEAEGLTKAQLAALLGKSKSLVSDVLAGRRHGFTREQIATLARHFRLDHGYFF